MKKSELRVAIQEMDTYQFGLKNELHNKLTKVTSYVPKKEVIDLINQLEEPEQEKVVVPQFVADWIELCKKRADLSDCLRGSFNYGQGDFKTEIITEDEDWLFEYDHADLVARAWLDGYSVEEQKLYHVPLHDGTYLVSDDDKNLSKGTTYFMHQEDSGFLNRVHIFTEQEIKNIDERYWAFAEEITK